MSVPVEGNLGQNGEPRTISQMYQLRRLLIASFSTFYPKFSSVILYKKIRMNWLLGSSVLKIVGCTRLILLIS
jgi:hypothetical protein